MRSLRYLLLVALAMMLSTTAWASFGKGPSNPPPSSSREPEEEGTKAASTPRQEADRWYQDAYEDVQKGKTELAAGKDKSAEKRFRRAIERAEKSIALDSTYHQAWNLVGYASRKLKDYDRALSAYQRCLRLQPDYAPAREYLGEAYLELGKLAEARQQLGFIDAIEAPEEARALQTAIDAWVKANPSAAPAASGSSGSN